MILEGHRPLHICCCRMRSSIMCSSCHSCPALCCKLSWASWAMVCQEVTNYSEAQKCGRHSLDIFLEKLLNGTLGSDLKTRNSAFWLATSAAILLRTCWAQQQHRTRRALRADGSIAVSPCGGRNLHSNGAMLLFVATVVYLFASDNQGANGSACEWPWPREMHCL